MSTKNNLLVELFVEELPPKALKKLGDAFASQLRDQLVAQGLADAGSVLTAYASPRRLAAHLSDVLAQAADRAVAQKLMPVSVGLDASGEPTPALQKRLAALGVAAGADALAGLRRAMDGKAEALFHDSTVRGASLAEGLQKALAEAIAKLPIPKLMSYQLESGCELPGWTSVSFVRPAHGLVALHGDQVVSVSALGLVAGRETHGHRFEAAVDPVVLRDANSYAVQLSEEGAVIAGFEARRSEIARQLAEAALRVGGAVQPIPDEALLDEVTALVERPKVLVCEFEREFLEVPQECLILTMKANQKYFPCSMPRAGSRTASWWSATSVPRTRARWSAATNAWCDRGWRMPSSSSTGPQEVARFARRFAGQGGLSQQARHPGRTGRARDAHRACAGRAAAAGRRRRCRTLPQATQAAQLAKADLVTDMVGEFPELQGTMGRYYALHDGLEPSVAEAIEDHYKPRFAGDGLPRSQVGIVGGTGRQARDPGRHVRHRQSADRRPRSLRAAPPCSGHRAHAGRACLALALVFDQMSRAAFAVFPAGMLEDRGAELDEFLIERLKSYFKDEGYSAIEIDAAVHAGKLEAGPAFRSASTRCAPSPRCPRHRHWPRPTSGSATSSRSRPKPMPM